MIIRILFLITILVAVLFGVNRATSSPKFCETCHIMRPEVMTWQASAHSKIPCTICHIEPGLQNTLKHQGEIIRRFFLVQNQQYSLPLEIKHMVRSEVCLGCHTLVRPFTPLNDIKVPHEKHVKAGIECVNCHQGVVHARLGQRGLASEGNLNQWTPQYGAAQILPVNLRIGMQECMDCHSKRHKGPTQCVGCHEKKQLPSSHMDTQRWQTNHGKAATKDVKPCEDCHNYLNIDGRKLTEEETMITRYARNNSFCNDCHVASDAKHIDSWAIIHAKVVTLDSAQSCLVCHDLEQPKPGENRPETYCTMCHQNNLGPTSFFN